MVSGREGGTGLGLSIARNLIDQHSGKLNLPVGRDIPSFRFSCRLKIKVTFMQRGIVWVVDDDSSIRWVLERALTGAGLSCTTFESGSEVLDALTTKTPDVLLGYSHAGHGRTGALKADQTAPPHASGHHNDRPLRPDAAVSAYQQGRLIICQNRLISTKPLPGRTRHQPLSGATAAPPRAGFRAYDGHHR